MALSANCLTLITTVEGELGISTGTEDTFLTRLIEACTKRIENYCNRVFKYDAAIVEYTKGYGTAHLALAQPPIESVTSIYLDDTLVDSEDYKIQDSAAGILYAANGWNNTASIYSDIEGDIVAGTEDILYKVTYKGGWVTPPQVTGSPPPTRSLPYDLEQACIEFVVMKYRSKGRDPAITAERLMSASVNYAQGTDADADIPTSIRAVLDQYRRFPVA